MVNPSSTSRVDPDGGCDGGGFEYASCITAREDSSIEDRPADDRDDGRGTGHTDQLVFWLVNPADRPVPAVQAAAVRVRTGLVLNHNVTVTNCCLGRGQGVGV